MKLTFLILGALTTLSAAAGQDRNLVTGREYYAEAQFGKAAAQFQVACKINSDAEACYWAGISYERLADILIPFGCRTNAKAHEYLTEAMRLEPGRPVYRKALFDFLLNTADCSRTSLSEAAGILSAMSESDPDHGQMSRRFEQEKHLNGSVNARLARLFLLAPRATYRLAALPAPVLRSRNAAAGRCPALCGGALQTTSAAKRMSSPRKTTE
jgi:hypothetical protein